MPSITRKTDKGLPKYDDAEESDVFILSSAEDLVPVLNRTVDNNGNDKWDRDSRRRSALALPRGDSDFRLAVDRTLSHIYKSGEIAPSLRPHSACRRRQPIR